MVSLERGQVDGQVGMVLSKNFALTRSSPYPIPGPPFLKVLGASSFWGVKFWGRRVLGVSSFGGVDFWGVKFLGR